MLRYALVSFVIIVALLAVNVQAAPLSVRIDDHDFSFDVPYSQQTNWGAVYDFNGRASDSLYIQSSIPNHYVGSYSYVGKLPTVPPSPPNPFGNPPAPYPFIYPVANSSTFGGDLELNMTFDYNDGPYIDPNTGDRFDISLVGKEGHLTITGQIYTPGFVPLYPAGGVQPQDIVLLDIAFEQVTLLARVNEDRIFMIEGYGRINMLLGYDVLPGMDLPEEGVTFFKFFAEMPQGPIFTDPNYQPTDDYQGIIMGRISGEAGAGVPEPATLALLGLGGLGLLLKRRRR